MRCLAVLFSAVVLAPSLGAAEGIPFRDVHVDGLDLRKTSGTAEVQRVRAAESLMAPDLRSVQASRVVVTMQMPRDGREVRAEAPEARYYTGATVLEEAPTQATLPRQWLLSLEKLLEQSGGAAPEMPGAFRDDFVLAPGAEGGMAVRLDLQGLGSLRASNLAWTEAYGSFAGAGPFVQEATVGSSGTLTISGGAFVADRTFQEWTYPVLHGRSVRIEYRAAGTPPGTPQP